MGAVGHSFSLPLDNYEVIRGALRIYTQWFLFPKESPVPINADKPRFYPVCVVFDVCGSILAIPKQAAFWRCEMATDDSFKNASFEGEQQLIMRLRVHRT